MNVRMHVYIFRVWRWFKWNYILLNPFRSFDLTAQTMWMMMHVRFFDVDQKLFCLYGQAGQALVSIVFCSPCFRLEVKFCAYRGEFFCRLWNWFDLLLVFFTLHQHLFTFVFFTGRHVAFSACLTQKCQFSHDLKQSHSYWTCSVTTVMEI